MAIIPFGKYKGQPVEAVKHADPSYWDWLLEQPWFRQKFSSLTQVNVTNVTVQENKNTPAHNKLQMEFLDDEYVIAMLDLCSKGTTFGVETKFEPRDVWIEATKWEPKYEYEHAALQGPPTWRDGVYRVACSVEIKPTLGDDFGATLRQILNHREIDLRKEHRGVGYILVAGRFTGEGVTKDQLREVFRKQNIALIWQDEIDALFEYV